MEIIIVLTLLFSIIPFLLELPFVEVKKREIFTKYDDTDLFSYYEDMKFNYFLSRGFLTGSDFVRIFRIDDCTIDYYYDRAEEKLKKRVSCTSAPAVRDASRVVGNVRSFGVLNYGDYFCFSVQKTTGSYHLCVGG